MVENLCSHYGSKVCDFGGKTFFAFPTPAALSKAGVEDKLRSLGFGYRAAYIAKTAQQVKNLKTQFKMVLTAQTNFNITIQYILMLSAIMLAIACSFIMLIVASPVKERLLKQLVDKGGDTYLHDLRSKPYDEARKELLTFSGIGPKVWRVKLGRFVPCNIFLPLS